MIIAAKDVYHRDEKKKVLDGRNILNARTIRTRHHNIHTYGPGVHRSVFEDETDIDVPEALSLSVEGWSEADKPALKQDNWIPWPRRVKNQLTMQACASHFLIAENPCPSSDDGRAWVDLAARISNSNISLTAKWLLLLGTHSVTATGVADWPVR
ncbi:hypothetical protein K438DRAFT_1752000 [Mycena galopus ATCC 62051]|nr:hypothetical protein K438DRAFT_1752000 [Mycena galopus ATCC 62051]